MGILVYVYRSARGWDCTNGGESAKFTEFTVTNAQGPFQPSASAPAAILEEGPMGSVRLVPQSVKDTGKHYMFGGNYAASSDSRFSEAVQKILNHRFYGAIAIHDRVEG